MSGSLNPASTDLPDEELARQAQDGSLDAFEHLVHRFEKRVYAFISQFCRNETDARELTQDTFVRAFQKIGQFNPARAFAPWLFTIARRQCIDRHRLAPPRADAPLPELVDEVTPVELVANREDSVRLWQLARERLSQSQFEALWLHYAEEMEIAHIAQVLRKTRVHVKVLLFRARAALARELGPAHAAKSALPSAASPGPASLRSTRNSYEKLAAKI